MKRAFRLTAYGNSGIMAAESCGQAKFRLFRELKDNGYRPTVSAIRCRRAPEHDAWAEVDETGVCWAEQYLPGRIFAQ
jgi:hypothetical protein